MSHVVDHQIDLSGWVFSPFILKIRKPKLQTVNEFDKGHTTSELLVVKLCDFRDGGCWTPPPILSTSPLITSVFPKLQ